MNRELIAKNGVISVQKFLIKNRDEFIVDFYKIEDTSIKSAR